MATGKIVVLLILLAKGADRSISILPRVNDIHLIPIERRGL